MKLAWVTDPHIDHTTEANLRRAMRAGGQVDAAICTGDLSSAPRLREHLHQLREAFRCPVYFVLGNHDYYGGGFASVRESLHRPQARLTWLRTAPPVELVPGVVLTGHDGWYDGRAGQPDQTPVILNDFDKVSDVRTQIYRTGFGYSFADRPGLLATLRRISDVWAAEAEAQLRAAMALRPKKIIFATHVPPFPGSCWHEGQVSNGDWQPWFVNTALGDVLDRVSAEEVGLGIEFEVLCGHTHSPGVFQRSPNLVVRTGGSRYGSPSLAGIFDLG